MIILHIAGHLGSDPETRFTPTGKKVTSFRVATNIKRGGKEKTVWWRVTVWGDRFEKLMTYLKKGSAVFVVGEMGIPEIYTDKNGVPQTSFEITAEVISLNPFGRSGAGKPADSPEGAVAEESTDSPFASFPGKAETGVVPGAGQANFAEDDIPF
jgi:single-strand DNA-binding protein